MLDALQNWPPLRYIVAAEQEPTIQAAIVKVSRFRISIYIFISLAGPSSLQISYLIPRQYRFHPFWYRFARRILIFQFYFMRVWSCLPFPSYDSIAREIQSLLPVRKTGWFNSGGLERELICTINKCSRSDTYYLFLVSILNLFLINVANYCLCLWLFILLHQKSQYLWT